MKEQLYGVDLRLEEAALTFAEIILPESCTISLNYEFSIEPSCVQKAVNDKKKLTK